MSKVRPKTEINLKIKTQTRSELHSSICYIECIFRGAVLTGQNYVNYFLIVCDVSVRVVVDYGHVGLSGSVFNIAMQQILMLPLDRTQYTDLHYSKYCLYYVNYFFSVSWHFTKIIKIFTTRCRIFRLKCSKFDFGWGSAPHPLGELTALPRPQLD